MPQPPLYAIEGFGPPAGAQTVEVRSADGLSLRTAFFPAPNARGSVVLNNGRTEFIEKYYEVIGELVARGFSVVTHDWRGQGLSSRLLADRLKGYAVDAPPFLDDLDLILETYGARLPRPWIVVGHSMGGALTLLHLLQRPGAFDAAVLSSPMTGVNLQRNIPIVVRLLILVRWLFGRLGDYVTAPKAPPWDDHFNPDNTVTNDEARFTRTVDLLKAHHDLALNGATWGWLNFALNAARAIQSSPAAATLQIPLRIVAAGDERLADTAATQAFCARVPKGQCVVAPGAKHEILMETDATRALFWASFDEAAAGLSNSQPRTSAA